MAIGRFANLSVTALGRFKLGMMSLQQEATQTESAICSRAARAWKLWAATKPPAVFTSSLSSSLRALEKVLVRPAGGRFGFEANKSPGANPETVEGHGNYEMLFTIRPIPCGMKKRHTPWRDG